MKCISCGRTLTKPALTVPSSNGLLWFGPKCARAIAPRAPRTPAVRDSRAPRYRDAATADLFEELPC